MNTDISEKQPTWKEMPRSCSEPTCQYENLFFEMSRVVDRPEMLMSRVEWFRRLHIPCAIAKTNGGYTLWRKGTEVGRKRSKIPQMLMEKNIVFSVGLTGRELNLLKEKQQEGAGGSSGGFEDVALPRWEESGENQFDIAASVS